MNRRNFLKIIVGTPIAVALPKIVPPPISITLYSANRFGKTMMDAHMLRKAFLHAQTYGMSPTRFIKAIGA